MTFKEMALRMYPFWLTGALLLFATIKAGYGHLVRVEKQALKDFFSFMVKITIFRVILFTFFPGVVDFMMGDAKSAINTIPLGATAFVFWEDMVHILPLVLLFSKLNDSKAANYVRIGLTAATMFAFGMGHTYQGWIAAFMLAFYVPIVTKLGEKYGVGTVMICHTFYDLATLITLRLLLG